MTRGGFDRIRASGQAGFSALELVIVVAVIGILMAASTPFFRSFRTSAVRAGGEEMAALLGQARLLAIKDNTNVCVTNNGTSVQYLVRTAADCSTIPGVTSVWGGPGTDAAGFIRLANNVTVAPSTAAVVFTYIGTANAPVAYTVSSPPDPNVLSVTVAASGRIHIGP